MPAEYESRRQPSSITEPDWPGFIPPPGLSDAEYERTFAFHKKVQHLSNPRNMSAEAQLMRLAAKSPRYGRGRR
jgi:hypothetical protein